MNLKTLLQLVCCLLLVSLNFGCSNTKNKEATTSTPNMVFILSDDQAWSDYGFMGHPHIQTPAIDELAAEGRTFTRGYVTTPLCRPSLASIITGLYPHLNGITGNDPGLSYEGRRWSDGWKEERARLNKEFVKQFQQIPTLPVLLREKGYVSFQAGKWWEGSWKDGGFTDGMTYGDLAHGGRHGDEGLDIGRDGMQPVFNFMDSEQQKGQPFFLWYAPFMPHTPHTPPDSLLKKYLQKAPNEAEAKYWAMIEWFDFTVGQLLNYLEQKGLTENTVVVYVCDNGWIQNPRPETGKDFMPRSKQSPYDMGIRTPIIYKWPGHISPKMDTSTFVSSLDMVPTVLQAVGLEPTPDMEGINVMDKAALEKRTSIFSADFSHDMTDINHPAKSLESRIILKKPWKLIVPYDHNIIEASVELYNIVEDPFEQNNMAKQHPEQVEALQSALDQWWDPGHQQGL